MLPFPKAQNVSTTKTDTSSEPLNSKIASSLLKRKNKHPFKGLFFLT